MLDVRVRGFRGGSAGEMSLAAFWGSRLWLKGDAKFGMDSRLCHPGWVSTQSVSQELDCARGRGGFTPSITIGRSSSAAGFIALLPIPAPSEAFSCSRRCASAPFFVSGNAGRLSLCSVQGGLFHRL